MLFFIKSSLIPDLFRIYPYFSMFVFIRYPYLSYTSHTYPIFIRYFSMFSLHKIHIPSWIRSPQILIQ